MPHLYEIINTGYDVKPWLCAIDGFYVRTTRGNLRWFKTDSAAIKALRKEAVGRGYEYFVPHLRY